MDGVLVVAKPTGPTSHDVVALIRRLAATKRVGHGGTLDPFASGVLPVFVGTATRLVEFHMAATKRYRATICLGAGTTTDDLEGDVTPVEGDGPTRSVVEAAMQTMVGPMRQRPPAYSAVRIRGRRAYALARKGERAELPERDVVIGSLDLRAWDESDSRRPIAVVDVVCSAGTYVRAIARDLGAAVGSAGYLGALVRTASGPFRIEEATTLDEIRQAAADGPERLARLLLPLDTGLDALPEATLDDAAVEAIIRGRVVPAPTLAQTDDPIRVRDTAGRLVAIGRLSAAGLAPSKVLVDVGHG